MPGICGAWTWASGAVGFKKGNEVHTTDWGHGVTRSIRDTFAGLPEGWDDVDAIYTWADVGNSWVAIRGTLMHVGSSQKTESLGFWDSLPDEWLTNGGISGAWTWASGAVGFKKGNQVHTTDWNHGITRTVRECFVGLPEGWDDVDAIYTRAAGDNSWVAIRGSQMYFSSSKETEPLSHWDSLPSLWK
ncbi:hypothetical protein ACHGLA_35100 [Streptomyces sp. YH02]|uniref:hypothetical protein n=1 Tax=Streptomyces sp. YH02 TaxID=3256999 RepID=UPI003757FC0F